jgi:hypothetical protein
MGFIPRLFAVRSYATRCWFSFSRLDQQQKLQATGACVHAMDPESVKIQNNITILLQ